MIKIEQVSIKYIKDYYSLFNINLEIKNNTLLLGDKTSGNNFLLRLLAKIDRHYEGQIFVDNVNLKKIKDSQLNLAYLPRENYFFKNKSVLKNLIYPLKIRKIDSENAKNIVNLLLKQYEIKNFLKNLQNLNFIFDEKYKDKFNKNFDFETNFLNVKMKYYTFSMQKILLLLRAVVRKPKYILLENFFENLDTNFFELANKILNDVSKSSIIIATENKNNLKYFKNYSQIKFNAGSIVNFKSN